MKTVKANRRKMKKSAIIIAVIAIILVIASAAAIYLLFLRPADSGPAASDPAEEETSGILTVRVLDIGQGDSILITTPGGKHILIDTGMYTEERLLNNRLISFGVDEIEYLVLTHPHGDHIGNAAFVLKNYKTKNVIMINMSGASYSYTALLNELEKQTEINVIEAKAGYEFSVSGAEFRILSPKQISTDMNESSIVLKMIYGDNSMIFMGDVGEETEQWLMRNYTVEELKSDVIKIGHHGSRYSSTRAFLMTVAPEYAAISCGRDNEYGHPHSRVTNTLTSLGIETLRTDLMGTISFYFYGDKVTTRLED